MANIDELSQSTDSLGTTTNSMSEYNASTSYTILSPRATHTVHGTSSNTIPSSSMNPVSPTSIMRPVSPPTPAPSPQPSLATTSHATPGNTGSVLMAHSGSAAMGEPGTPISPGTEDVQGLAWGNPNIHVHPSHFGLQSMHTEAQEALFASQFLHYVTAHFPRLTGPERRTLFTSLLPYMAGEDLLHLSELISPYLRRDFLSELPAEIALKILTFIDDPKDLVRASRVNRTWRSLVADEQNWKLMLQKYNGGGWAETRPALGSNTSSSVTFPAAAGRHPADQARIANINARLGNAASSSARMASSANASHIPSQRLATIAQASSSRIQEYRPSRYPAQNSFYGADQSIAGPSATSSMVDSTSTSSVPFAESSSTSSHSLAHDSENGEEVNRFLDENQTPLAERTRRKKGKGRATPSGGSSELVRDLSAAGFAGEGQIPSGSNPATIGLVPVEQNVLRGSSPAGALRGLGVIPPRTASTAFSSQSAPSAAAVLASQQLQQSTSQSQRSISTHQPPPFSAFPFPPPGDLTGSLQQLSLAPGARPLIPALTTATPQAPFTSSSNVPSTVSSAISPSATFQPAYVSPGQYATQTLGQTPVDAATLVAPSVIAADLASPIFTRHPSYVLPTQAQSAPQPVRTRVAKSQNPFGTAQTNLSYTSQYQNGSKNSTSSTACGQSFSYKTQFKKAYLTESNWLKGPGRVLSRQTCTDDGVVTSLGFDNEWIIVGMATNQIHVFDAKTGAYVQQLVGHSLGVWCLVLVSKGGHRVDKDGKRLKSPSMEEPKVPNVFRQSYRTSWSSDDNEEESGSDDSSDTEASPTTGKSSNVHLGSMGMERMRSASARPADRERFFQEASDSLLSSPNLLEPNDGSPQARRNSHSSRRQRRLSTDRLSSEPLKPRNNRRPSSFCGMPSAGQQDGPSASSSRFNPNPSGFPFGGDGANISPQQAAACGTAQGWGQPGAVAVSGGCDRDVRVWDVATGRCIHLLRGHMSTVRCLKVLDGRPIAVSGSRDNTLRVWDIERGVLVHVLSGHQHSVRCIEISGNRVVSGSYDATCKIWDVDTGECLHTLQGHQHQIYAVAFDGNRVASGSLDSTVRIWSAKTGECLALLQGHTSLVGQLQLTDSLLVTGGSDGRVIVFSLSTFECLHRLCAHDNSVTCLQFNDRFMVTGGNDGRVKLWDRPTGKLIRDLAEPCEAVWRVTFREDKFVLLCKRGNRTIMEVRTFAPFEEEL